MAHTITRTTASWRDRLTTAEIVFRMFLIALVTLAIPPAGRWLGRKLAIEFRVHERYVGKEAYTPTLRSAQMVSGLGGAYDQEPTVAERRTAQ